MLSCQNTIITQLTNSRTPGSTSVSQTLSRVSLLPCAQLVLPFPFHISPKAVWGTSQACHPGSLVGIHTLFTQLFRTVSSLCDRVPKRASSETFPSLQSIFLFMLTANYFWLMNTDTWEVYISLQLEPWQVTTIFFLNQKSPRLPLHSL